MLNKQFMEFVNMAKQTIPKLSEISVTITQISLIEDQTKRESLLQDLMTVLNNPIIEYEDRIDIRADAK